MISMPEARAILLKNLPGSKIKKAVEYDGSYIFLATMPDPEEPDNFFSVDRRTKAFSDYSPWTDARDPQALQSAFRRA